MRRYSALTRTDLKKVSNGANAVHGKVSELGETGKIPILGYSSLPPSSLLPMFGKLLLSPCCLKKIATYIHKQVKQGQLYQNHVNGNQK